MGEFDFLGLQPKTAEAERLPKKAIVMGIAMHGIAHQRMGQPSHVTPDLMIPTGFGPCFHQRISRRGVPLANGVGKLDARAGPIASARGQHVATRVRLERMISHPLVIRPAPNNRKICFIYLSGFELSAKISCRFLIERENEDPVCGDVQTVNRKNVLTNLVPKVRKTGHLFRHTPTRKFRLMNMKTRWLLDRDEIAFPQQNLEAGFRGRHQFALKRNG